MGHFSEQYITDCDLHTSDDDYLDRRDGVSSAPSILRNPPITRDYAEHLAAGLARVTRLPAHVVNDAGHLLICDDIDIALWGLDQIVYTVEPEHVYCDASWSTAPTATWNEAIPGTDIHMASWSTAPTASADPPTDAPGHDEDGVPHALLIDIAQTLDMALGRTHGNASIVSELRRVRAEVKNLLGAHAV